jgi:hypothetical protein
MAFMLFYAKLHVADTCEYYVEKIFYLRCLIIWQYEYSQLKYRHGNKKEYTNGHFGF